MKQYHDLIANLLNPNPSRVVNSLPLMNAGTVSAARSGMFEKLDAELKSALETFVATHANGVSQARLFQLYTQIFIFAAHHEAILTIEMMLNFPMIRDVMERNPNFHVLNEALFCCDDKMLNCLFHGGLFNVNYENAAGYTPIHHLILSKEISNNPFLKALEVLIKNGADLSSPDHEGVLMTDLLLQDERAKHVILPASSRVVVEATANTAEISPEDRNDKYFNLAMAATVSGDHKAIDTLMANQTIPWDAINVFSLLNQKVDEIKNKYSQSATAGRGGRRLQISSLNDRIVLNAYHELACQFLKKRIGCTHIDVLRYFLNNDTLEYRFDYYEVSKCYTEYRDVIPVLYGYGPEIAKFMDFDLAEAQYQTLKIALKRESALDLVSMRFKFGNWHEDIFRKKKISPSNNKMGQSFRIFDCLMRENLIDSSAPDDIKLLAVLPTAYLLRDVFAELNDHELEFLDQFFVGRLTNGESLTRIHLNETNTNSSVQDEMLVAVFLRWYQGLSNRVGAPLCQLDQLTRNDIHWVISNPDFKLTIRNLDEYKCILKHSVTLSSYTTHLLHRCGIDLLPALSKDEKRNAIYCVGFLYDVIDRLNSKKKQARSFNNETFINIFSAFYNPNMKDNEVSLFYQALKALGETEENKYIIKFCEKIVGTAEYCNSPLGVSTFRTLFRACSDGISPRKAIFILAMAPQLIQESALTDFVVRHLLLDDYSEEKAHQVSYSLSLITDAQFIALRNKLIALIQMDEGLREKLKLMHDENKNSPLKHILLTGRTSRKLRSTTKTYNDKLLPLVMPSPAMVVQPAEDVYDVKWITAEFNPEHAINELLHSKILTNEIKGEIIRHHLVARSNQEVGGERVYQAIADEDVDTLRSKLSKLTSRERDELKVILISVMKSDHGLTQILQENAMATPLRNSLFREIIRTTSSGRFDQDTSTYLKSYLSAVKEKRASASLFFGSFWHNEPGSNTDHDKELVERSLSSAELN